MSENAEHAMTLGERVREAMQFETIFTIQVGTISIPITETVVTMWVVMAVLILGSILLTRKMTLVPKVSQVFRETFVGSLNDFFKA